VTYTDYLIKHARRYWSRGQHLPGPLFHEMLRAKLDVDGLEELYMKKDAD